MARTKDIEVEFFVDPRPLTLYEKQLISDFIKHDKLSQKTNKRSKKAQATIH